MEPLFIKGARAEQKRWVEYHSRQLTLNLLFFIQEISQILLYAIHQLIPLYIQLENKQKRNMSRV